MSWFGGGDSQQTGDAGGSSLYDKFKGNQPAVANSPTRSSELRKANVRINCYLNQEGVGVVVVGGPRGHGTIVQLPTEVDSLEEVLPHIQLKLKLDERMCYACDLFLPDGKLINSFPELVAAAKAETPIIVGCGEPFDGSRVPQDLLEFYLQGGGRSAVHKVTGELAKQRAWNKRDVADSVRQEGHGVYPNSLAVVNARSMAVEANREKAAMMRQRYLQGLVKRSEEDNDYLRSAQQNIMFHKMEEEESRARREDYERERMEKLNAERTSTRLDVNKARSEDAERRAALHAKVKEGKARAKLKYKEARSTYKKNARVEDYGSRPGRPAYGTGPDADEDE